MNGQQKLFRILQAELNQQSGRDNKMTSKDKYVPSDASDSEIGLLEEDLTE